MIRLAMTADQLGLALACCPYKALSERELYLRGFEASLHEQRIDDRWPWPRRHGWLDAALRVVWRKAR